MQKYASPHLLGSADRLDQVVAIDSETGALLNFQTLSNRARKDVQIGDIKVRARIFAFDLMHLNGRVSALQAPLLPH